MTEQEWLACPFSTPMFEFLRDQGAGSWRKRFLLSVACCGRVVGQMSEDGRRAVEVAEQFVAGMAGAAERGAAFERAGTAMEEANDLRTHKADWCAYRLVQLAAERERPATWDDDWAAQIAQTAPEAFAWTGSRWDEATLQAHRSAIAAWVRDILGPLPFRPVVVNPAWRTSIVVNLAQAIYADLGFDRLPILADALEDAGCPNAEILEHCRGPGSHVRGCWVLDVLLGKE